MNKAAAFICACPLLVLSCGSVVAAAISLVAVPTEATAPAWLVVSLLSGSLGAWLMRQAVT
jgi:hypothetical protein